MNNGNNNGKDEPSKPDKPIIPTAEDIAAAGEDTLREYLTMSLIYLESMAKMLMFARSIARSATGNMITLDRKLEDFDEIVEKYRG